MREYTPPNPNLIPPPKVTGYEDKPPAQTEPPVRGCATEGADETSLAGFPGDRNNFNEVYAYLHRDEDPDDAIDTDEPMCETRFDGWSCTQQWGHEGPHRARGDRFGRIYAEWERIFAEWIRDPRL